MRRSRTRSVTAAIGGAFVASLAFASVADTSANPFGAEVLPQGYELLADAHGKGDKEGEGKCGEGKCGEGKCGEDKGDDKAGEGKCGEGKCGEGKCGEASS
ncbi:MAG: hypothetical protein KF911_08335 [Pseudomonadales bacterium]|nr:hypothetical protein [Pseudomonadales bacterium]